MKLALEKVKICVIQAEFNELITKALLEGALDELHNFGIAKDNCKVLKVPGSFEIPVVAANVLSADYDAVIALGCIIRGETAHFDYVAGPCASALMNLSVQYKKPVIFGVLTTDTLEQAMHRAGIKLGNKGREAAISAIKTLSVLKTI